MFLQAADTTVLFLLHSIVLNIYLYFIFLKLKLPTELDYKFIENY